MTNIEIYRKRITALIFMSCTPILAISPFLIGMLGSLITPGCTNESSCGWAVLPWFMFLTIPAGAIFFIVALVLFVNSLTQRLSKSGQPDAHEKRLKRYQFAWMATASGPLVLVLALMLSLALGPVSTCNSNDVCSQNANGFIVQALVIAAPCLLVGSWLYLLAVAIWNKLSKRSTGATPQ